jgi:hypothetical protein
MANDEPGVLIHIIVRDSANGELLTVKRIDRDTYEPPPGHEPRRIAEAVDGCDARYTYVGAVVYPPLGPLANQLQGVRSWRSPSTKFSGDT